MNPKDTAQYGLCERAVPRKLFVCVLYFQVLGMEAEDLGF